MCTSNLEKGLVTFQTKIYFSNQKFREQRVGLDLDLQLILRVTLILVFLP